MSEQLQKAIETVKENQYSFCKFISANDAGKTGGHQGGIYIPKNSIKLLFDEPGVRGENKERDAAINWFDGTVSDIKLKYYGQETRNEYRITRLGENFNVGDLVVIVKINDNTYKGFIFSKRKEIDSFLKTFNLTEAETNCLIDKDKPEELVNSIDLSFKPRARLLLQLGDQLIKNESIALVELVKNSYDADATKTDIYMENVDDPEEGIIIIEDDGYGMNAEIVANVWMEPGSDFKSEKFAKKEGSPKFHRLPIGEKGIGRFGVHKLGNQIEMTTKKANSKEVYVKIDWTVFN